MVDIGHTQTQRPGEFLGRNIKRINVILARIEEITNLFVRHRECVGPRRRILHIRPVPLLGDQRQLVRHIAIAAVNVHQRAGKLRVSVHEIRHLLHINAGGAHLAVQSDVVNLGDQAGIVFARKESLVDSENMGDFPENRRGQWATVIFNLVDVTGRETESMRKGCLA